MSDASVWPGDRVGVQSANEWSVNGEGDYWVREGRAYRTGLSRERNFCE